MTAKPAALLLLIPALLAAATVEGTVKDPSGAAVPGADVSLKNSATAQTQSTQSDTQGHFAFAGVAVSEAPVTVSPALRIVTQETEIKSGASVRRSRIRIRTISRSAMPSPCARCA